ncbi:hypothetical protein J6590_044920 [Homalodisca vitripennis]|nr:hypothetical protein J6590_044920 [Homalodisca vitripennis]
MPISPSMPPTLPPANDPSRTFEELSVQNSRELPLLRIQVSHCQSEGVAQRLVSQSGYATGTVGHSKKTRETWSLMWAICEVILRIEIKLWAHLGQIWPKRHHN